MSVTELNSLKRTPGETDKTHLLSNNKEKQKETQHFKEILLKLKESLKRAFLIKYNWLLSIWGFCGLTLGMNKYIYLMLKFIECTIKS